MRAPSVLFAGNVDGRKLAAIAILAPRSSQLLARMYVTDVELHIIINEFREARFSHGLRCPRCGHDGIQCWGWFSHRRRYRCRGCRRTFSDFTGTPAAYSKKLRLWPRYATCFAEAVSVREAARQLDIHPSTAFRWRHRILDWLRDHDTERVSGWVEIAHHLLPESQKGSRNLDRPPRSHTPDNIYYHIAERGRCIRVWFACDRRGNIVSGHHPRDADAAKCLASIMADRIAPDSCLISAGAPPVFSDFAAAAQLEFHHHNDPPWRHPLKDNHVAIPYRIRWYEWLVRFRGVATKYLSNYLIWHRSYDVATRHGSAAAAVRWPVGPAYG